MCDTGQTYQITCTKHETDDEGYEKFPPHQDSWFSDELDNQGNKMWLVFVEDLESFIVSCNEKVIVTMFPKSGSIYSKLEIYNFYRE